MSIAEDVPAETKAKVEEIKKGLADGSFAIWKGPITDNTGKVQVAKDTVANASAAVPRPLASSLMPLHHSPRCHRLPATWVCLHEYPMRPIVLRRPES